jgi:hypothetical protein
MSNNERSIAPTMPPRCVYHQSFQHWSLSLSYIYYFLYYILVLYIYINRESRERESVGTTQPVVALFPRSNGLFTSGLSNFLSLPPGCCRLNTRRRLYPNIDTERLLLAATAAAGSLIARTNHFGPSRDPLDDFSSRPHTAPRASRA